MQVDTMALNQRTSEPRDVQPPLPRLPSFVACIVVLKKVRAVHRQRAVAVHK